jgi:transcriptional regulator with GAF, ATPase, and Fis domain
MWSEPSPATSHSPGPRLKQRPGQIRFWPRMCRIIGKLPATSLAAGLAVIYNGIEPCNIMDSCYISRSITGEIVSESQLVLLQVWQEICRHLEISESAGAVADLLQGQLPLSQLSIYRFESEQRRLRIVAAAPSLDGRESPGDIHLSINDAVQLERWLNRRAPTHWTTDRPKAEMVLQFIDCSSVDGDWLLAPLVGEHGAAGIMVAAATPDQTFDQPATDLLSALAEPLAVALDNDARLHEIASLREAAEAERRSLLRRMGRNDVGETIVGESSGLLHVMERVEMVGRSDVPVLILGETGTGKELVARAIHNRGERHNGPFIRVNCGAIPRELIDSQLFGHEKGSFTGASDTRQGWFERADMGTLFLDEIGELPLEAQVRLLRVLQDGFVERVGGAKLIRVNVRVVAATHRDLASMVREASFREDLWYRIAVFPILLPPLRERPEDIPAMARHFAERAAVRFGLAPVLPTEPDIRLLQSYDWPGNIRELGTVIDRAAILGNGRRLELTAALGLAAPQPSQATILVSESRTDAVAPRSSSVATLDVAMRAHIEAVLRATQGRVEGAYGAAKLLAINPHTLRARMRKLGIDWSIFRQPPSVA